MADETLAEMYEREGWYLSPESSFYEGPYDVESMDKEAQAVAVALYGPAVEWQEANIPLGMVEAVKVSQTELPVVTALDKQMTAGGILTPLADELFLPQDRAEIEGWIASNLPTWEDAERFIETKGIAVPAFAMAALKALWPLIASFIIGMVADMVMEWLGDKIGADGLSIGGEGTAGKYALYLRGKLVGYADGDITRGPSGAQGLIAKKLDQGSQDFLDIKQYSELPFGGD